MRPGKGLELAIFALGLSMVPGCFVNRSGTLDPCMTAEDCPSGETCVGGLCEPGAPDAGDAGLDAGLDAGPDAGFDGSVDAGSDAGFDAGDLCANGLMDPGELGVDCGGACPRCAGPTGVTDLLLWLRADDAPGAFSTWVDRSGNGHDFEAIPSVATPTYAATVPQLAGEPTLDFGEAARIRSTAGIPLASGPALTIVYVVRSRTTPGIVLESSEAQSGNTGAFLDLRNSAGTGQFEAKHGRPPTESSWRSNQIDDQWHWIISVRDLSRSSGEVEVFVDGVSSGAISSDGNVAPPLADYVWYLGGRNGTPTFTGFNGQIAEVIAYTRAIDGGDISHLGTYVSARYGL